MSEVRLQYSSELSQLPRMRALVQEVCRSKWDRPEDEHALCQLQLALHEAVANIIEHAYHNEPGRPILLELDLDSDRARLTLYHEGDDFDPATAPPPAFNGSRESGFGVYLIRTLTDEVSHFRGADGRCAVQLVKNRTPSSRE
jgi:anti-sigma regulatory factor (Ser/Thr protein kinase)